MDRAKAHPLPARDPVTGGTLVITELQGSESGITLRGRFEMPRFASLNSEQSRFLETFLRCRGMLNSVEKELGISYPTARARLDAVLKALDLTPRTEEGLPAVEAVEAIAPPVPPGEIGAPEPTPAPAKEPNPAELFETAFDPIPNPPEPVPRRSPMEILDAIERGEITADEAKKEVKNP